jgi:hypothetical protein
LPPLFNRGSGAKPPFLTCSIQQSQFSRVLLQERHSLRLRALRVPQAEQRMYMVRANQLVMNALTPSIKIRTAAFSKKSFKR